MVEGRLAFSPPTNIKVSTAKISSVSSKTQLRIMVAEMLSTCSRHTFNLPFHSVAVTSEQNLRLRPSDSASSSSSSKGRFPFAGSTASPEGDRDTHEIIKLGDLMYDFQRGIRVVILGLSIVRAIRLQYQTRRPYPANPYFQIPDLP
jgi:hypothetical protein